MGKKAENKILTVPNILSILRILASPFLFFALLKNTNYYDKLAIIIISFSLVTDVLDGFIARHYKQQSALGKILDPIADKILVVGTVIILFLTRGFPVVLTWLIIARDVLILVLSGFMMFGKLHKIPQSNVLGKAAMVFVSMTIFSFLIEIPYLEIIQRCLVAGCYLTIVGSGIFYLIKFLMLGSKKPCPD